MLDKGDLEALNLLPRENGELDDYVIMSLSRGWRDSLTIAALSLWDHMGTENYDRLFFAGIIILIFIAMALMSAVVIGSYPGIIIGVLCTVITHMLAQKMRN